MRDAHPLNELSALDGALESRLAGDGVTFARRVVGPRGRVSLMLFARPVSTVLADMRDHGRRLAMAIKSAPIGG